VEPEILYRKIIY